MNTLHKSASCIQYHRSSHPKLVSGKALLVVIVVLWVPHLLFAQPGNGDNQKEQSKFGIELEAVPIERPVNLPRAALDALSEDRRVASCLEDSGLSAKGSQHGANVGHAQETE